MLEQSGQAKSLTGQVLVRDLATALDGHGGISSITLNSDYTLTFTLADNTEVTTTSVRGATGAKGDKGTDGRAITSVTKTGTRGLVDTYKIQFSDNTSTTFTVTNGASIKSIAKTGASGLVDTYTVTLTDNTTSTFTVTNGNGIASITLQSGTHAAGTTDVYKITFDNGQYTTFSVYNGLNGSGSVVSVNAKQPDASGNVSLVAADVGAAPATNNLDADTNLAGGDFIQFYDTSASANKKTLWSNIVAKIRTALFGGANGFLKANGSGVISATGSIGVDDLADSSVTHAKLVPDALCSPVVVSPDSGEVNISLADAGATFLARWTAAQSTTTYVLNETISRTLPERFEIAFVNAWDQHRTLIKTSGVRVILDGGSSPSGAPQAQNFKISRTVGMVALKKLYSSASGDLWLLTGPAEVVS